MNEDQRRAKILPAAPQPYQVPADFSQQVSGPDNQPLRERNIGPKDHEGKHELAEIMQIVDLEHPRDRLDRRELYHEPYGEAQCCEHFANHEDHAPDRRKPFGVQRHGPIDGTKSDGGSVKDDSRTTDVLHFYELRRRSEASLFAIGPAPQEQVKGIPPGEIDNSTNPEPCRSEIKHRLLSQ